MAAFVETRNGRIAKLNLHNPRLKCVSFKDIKNGGVLNGFVQGEVEKGFPVFELPKFGKMRKLVLKEVNDTDKHRSEPAHISLFLQGSSVTENCAEITEGNILVIEKPFVEQHGSQRASKANLVGNKDKSDVCIWVITKKGATRCLFPGQDSDSEESEKDDDVSDSESAQISSMDSSGSDYMKNRSKSYPLRSQQRNKDSSDLSPPPGQMPGPYLLRSPGKKRPSARDIILLDVRRSATKEKRTSCVDDEAEVQSSKELDSSLEDFIDQNQRTEKPRAEVSSSASAVTHKENPPLVTRRKNKMFRLGPRAAGNQTSDDYPIVLRNPVAAALTDTAGSSASHRKAAQKVLKAVVLLEDCEVNELCSRVRAVSANNKNKDETRREDSSPSSEKPSCDRGVVEESEEIISEAEETQEPEEIVIPETEELRDSEEIIPETEKLQDSEEIIPETPEKSGNDSGRTTIHQLLSPIRRRNIDDEIDVESVSPAKKQATENSVVSAQHTPEQQPSGKLSQQSTPSGRILRSSVPHPTPPQQETQSKRQENSPVVAAQHTPEQQASGKLSQQSTPSGRILRSSGSVHDTPPQQEKGTGDQPAPPSGRISRSTGAPTTSRSTAISRHQQPQTPVWQGRSSEQSSESPSGTLLPRCHRSPGENTDTTSAKKRQTSHNHQEDGAVECDDVSAGGDRSQRNEVNDHGGSSRFGQPRPSTCSTVSVDAPQQSTGDRKTRSKPRTRNQVHGQDDTLRRDQARASTRSTATMDTAQQSTGDKGARGRGGPSQSGGASRHDQAGPSTRSSAAVDIAQLSTGSEGATEGGNLPPQRGGASRRDQAGASTRSSASANTAQKSTGDKGTRGRDEPLPQSGRGGGTSGLDQPTPSSASVDISQQSTGDEVSRGINAPPTQRGRSSGTSRHDQAGPSMRITVSIANTAQQSTGDEGATRRDCPPPQRGGGDVASRHDQAGPTTGPTVSIDTAQQSTGDEGATRRDCPPPQRGGGAGASRHDQAGPSTGSSASADTAQQSTGDEGARGMDRPPQSSGASRYDRAGPPTSLPGGASGGLGGDGFVDQRNQPSTSRDSQPGPSTSATSQPYTTPPGYTKLSDIKNQSIVNLYGVVKFFKPPWQSRGTDMCSVVVLSDPSTDSTLECILFQASSSLLPQIQSVGDVVRLHRIKISMYKDRYQGKSSRGFAALVFGKNPNETVSKETARVNTSTFTFTDVDKRAVEKLKEWSASKPDLFPMTDQVTVADIKRDTFFHIICQVTGIAKHRSIDSAVLTVTDGTAPQHEVYSFEEENYQVLVPAPTDSPHPSVDIFLYGDHAESARHLHLKAGSIVLLHSVHAAVFRDGPGVSLYDTVQPVIELCLHRGTDYGRGITLLQPNASEVGPLLDRLA